MRSPLSLNSPPGSHLIRVKGSPLFPEQPAQLIFPGMWFPVGEQGWGQPAGNRSLIKGVLLLPSVALEPWSAYVLLIRASRHLTQRKFWFYVIFIS